MLTTGIVLVGIWAVFAAVILFEVTTSHAQIPQPNVLLRFVLVAPWLLRAAMLLILAGLVLQFLAKRQRFVQTALPHPNGAGLAAMIADASTRFAPKK